MPTMAAPAGRGSDSAGASEEHLALGASLPAVPGFDPELFVLFRALVLGRVPRRSLRALAFGGRASAA